MKRDQLGESGIPERVGIADLVRGGPLFSFSRTRERQRGSNPEQGGSAWLDRRLLFLVALAMLARDYVLTQGARRR